MFVVPCWRYWQHTLSLWKVPNIFSRKCIRAVFRMVEEQAEEALVSVLYRCTSNLVQQPLHSWFCLLMTNIYGVISFNMRTCRQKITQYLCVSSFYPFQNIPFGHLFCFIFVFLIFTPLECVLHMTLFHILPIWKRYQTLTDVPKLFWNNGYTMVQDMIYEEHTSKFNKQAPWEP